MSSEKPAVSPLASILAERIRNQGKITFYDWMTAALYHPVFGYYNRSDLTRWGREGDYRTSPERSELFAATFARYFASLHDTMGEPGGLVVVEIGAGEGHFAAGVLETLKQRFVSIYESMHYLVIEVSEDARRRAAEKLERFSNVVFADFSDLKSGASMIVFSNELLDAFPVHRVKKINGALKEYYVTLSDASEFTWELDEVSDSTVAELSPMLVEGQVAEVSPEIVRWFEVLDQKVESGYLITVDYGAESKELFDSSQRMSGTLRAIRRHQFVEDILESPGDCDITSNVNWSCVKDVGRHYGFDVVEFCQLDRFLMKVGILAELEERLENCSDDAERSQLTTAAREMILPFGMASSFQVLVQKR